MRLGLDFAVTARVTFFFAALVATLALDGTREEKNKVARFLRIWILPVWMFDV